MTSEYRLFVDLVNNFVGTDGKVAANTFLDAINKLWWEHEEDLFYDSNQNNKNDEYSIVGDVYELLDRYDESDAIVATDPYCISDIELRQKIIEMLPRIKNPVYD